MNAWSFRTVTAAGFVSSLALLAGLAACTGGSGDAPPAAFADNLFSGLPTVCTRPASIPQGFDYPRSAEEIGRWVAARDEARIRAHGWGLWAGLNMPSGGQPVWRSWCTSTQAFAAASAETPAAQPAAAPAPANANANANAAAPAARQIAVPFHRQRSLNAIRRSHGAAGSEDPIVFPNAPVYPVPQQVQNDYPQCYIPPQNGQPAGLADGTIFESNGDIMIAGVIYNPPAYLATRGRRLFQGSTLDGMMRSPPTPPGQNARMPAMPAGSIALKPMMWPIAAEGYTALPVWDNPGSDNDSYAGFEIQSLWPRAVAVTQGPVPTGARADVTYLYNVKQSDGTTDLGPNTYRQAEVFSLANFYAFRFPDLAALDPCDRAILDASAWWAYNRPFQAGDALAVVAMHIMTKEQPAWTFQSVWWHDRPNDGVYAAGRPDLRLARGPWRHYLMASTYGLSAVPGGNSYPVAFNPYIELAADHPIRTNCMNCHHRAAWPRKPRNPHGSYEAPSPPGPDSLAMFDWTSPIFNGLLQTDALWSIPDRAYEPSGGTPAASGGGGSEVGNGRPARR
ncbi:MAG TPA: hypothetical protein VLK25_14415 [Allosphingosinicella sp.]|nr:hypothetical protein [Allosphingosinicella sp.]